MIKIKPLIYAVIGSLGIGGLAGFLTRNSMGVYSELKLPPLSPPPLIFPIAWTLLYILMGTSACLIYDECDSKTRNKAMILYVSQLLINFVWPLIFFNARAYLFAFLWLILLLALVIWMVVVFYKIKPSSAFLQIPYLIWLIYAAYLNFGVYLLNGGIH
jgi:tryptophan-rich sensory protein